MSLKIPTRLYFGYSGLDPIELGSLTIEEIRSLQALFKAGAVFCPSTDRPDVPIFMKIDSIEISNEMDDQSDISGLVCEFIMD